jgi:hypothetical protein
MVMADDLMTALRSLANRWTMLARDYARASKDSGTNEVQAQYNRGYAEGYYKAATELAALIKEQESKPLPPPQGGRRGVTGRLTPQPASASAPRPAPPAAPRPAPPAAPAVPAEPAVKYASMSVGEAINILVFAKCQPRDVTPNKDNSFRATFSSWGSLMLHEQVARVQSADPRIIVLNSGKLESHDYFIDFAFKEF